MEKENKKARKIKSEKLNEILASGITVKQYEIDFDKIKSIDDVVVLFRAMKVTLNWYSEECPEQFKEIYEKGFLKEK
jgi:sporulation protein YlmC with PRC-barrel domain